MNGRRGTIATDRSDVVIPRQADAMDWDADPDSDVSIVPPACLR